jgi:hypothetical protein
MKQYFDTGSPYLNVLNGLDESLKAMSPEEMDDDLNGVDVKAQGLAILKSAKKEAERRKAIAAAKRDLEDERSASSKRQRE